MPHQKYTLTLRNRKVENLHIVFWLLKDLSWCMVWKPLGIAMIFPTLFIAIYITYKSRFYLDELCHNLAVALWITANSYWMISEFLTFDTKILFATYTYKQLAIIPFLLGIIPLIYYYIFKKGIKKVLGK